MLAGEGPAAVMRKRLPAAAAYALSALVIVANTFNVGADIGGMAAAAHMIAPLPVDAWVFFFGVGLIACGHDFFQCGGVLHYRDDGRHAWRAWTP